MAVEKSQDGAVGATHSLHDVEQNPVRSDSRSFIVDFDGPDDIKDPLNWSSRYKWSMVILISVLSLIV